MSTATRPTLESELHELLTVARTWRRALGVEGGPTVRQCWLLARELRRAGLVTLKRSATLGTDYQVTHRPAGPPVVTLGRVKRTPEAEALRLVRALGVALIPARRGSRSVEDLRAAWERHQRLSAAFVAEWLRP